MRWVSSVAFYLAERQRSDPNGNNSFASSNRIEGWFAGVTPMLRAIRAGLERVPGALKDEPVLEEVAEGYDPATIIRRYDPDENTREVSRTPASDGLQISDQPTIAFEVPPALTDADVWNVLGDAGDDLKRLAQVKGIDAYGWYLTFHQRARQHGVYIPADRLIVFALQAFEGVSATLERRLEIAFYAILRHELFHFETDCMAANWELATGKEVYWRGRVDWHKELEEALANAYMLRGFRHPEGNLRDARGSYQALKDFCELQPSGYRDGPKYARSRLSYADGCRDLSFVFRCFSEDEWTIDSDALDTLIFFPNPFRIDWKRCPIIIHDRIGIIEALGIDLSFFETITGIVELRSFLRAIGKLGSRIEAIWVRRKTDLARSVNLTALGFEKWKPGGRDCYSVRLNGNYRVHLRRDIERNCWIAENIGDHKSMGHG